MRDDEKIQVGDIINRTISVLDDGFVRLIDYMGNDSSIVQAARVSYGAGTKHVSDDRSLIRYLMRHKHTTPFEMCELKLHVRVPMDCWRQWIRHRTANVNEYSTRYSIAIDSMHETRPSEWRSQSSGNRQGSEGNIAIEIGEQLSRSEVENHIACKAIYEERIGAGVAREQARKDLPLSTYTEAYWKIDLHNLFHFLSLRMNSSAQYEIRSYANVIGTQIVKHWVPMAWEAFLDYQINAIKLSAIEIEIMEMISDSRKTEVVNVMRNNGLLRQKDEKWVESSEASEFSKKLDRLGIKVPWKDDNAERLPE
ncbi:MAG: FAD-dependent thymidylate synthase [Candidatus Delongbacteria bacterium]